MARDLSELFNSRKRLTIVPGWAEIDSEIMQVVAALEIDGVTVVEGLQFRATARKRMPDEMITCLVEYHPDGEVGGPLSRLEWRPLKVHNNKARGPAEWQNKLIKGCHHHRFDLNLQYAAVELAKGAKLPIAVQLTASPANFALLKESPSCISAPNWERCLRPYRDLQTLSKMTCRMIEFVT
jgi:hypothetical protein